MGMKARARFTAIKSKLRARAWSLENKIMQHLEMAIFLMKIFVWCQQRKVVSAG